MSNKLKTKVCTKCLQSKSVKHFKKYSHNKAYNPVCISCQKQKLLVVDQGTAEDRFRFKLVKLMKYVQDIMGQEVYGEAEIYSEIRQLIQDINKELEVKS